MQGGADNAGNMSMRAVANMDFRNSINGYEATVPAPTAAKSPRRASEDA